VSDFLSFHLSDDFVEKYTELTPDWGFPIGGGNSLSELTFLTKYSRKKEDGSKERWYEVCRRCIEGMYSILKDHAKYQRTPWNEFKAQRAAQDAFDRMFHFKWTPPGRGMWAMGTSHVHNNRSNASLINCACVSTEKLSTHSAYEATLPFVRLTEMCMLGVGVGYDTKGAGKLTIWEPSEDQPVKFVIPDTREGWAESVGIQLESYFFKNRQAVEFDYSEIRPAGAPLKTFGGTASGKDPLVWYHESIRKQFAGRNGEKITSRDIVDIMNKLGKIIQSGGARRSALLSLGSMEDEDFVDIKNWELPENAERTGPDGWSFTSNNSVDVSENDTLDPIIDRIALNGEPGVIWTDVMQKYGRLVDPPDYKDGSAILCNPCFSGDTLIAVADGRVAVPIAELAESGDDVAVYSLNIESGEVEIKMARHPRKTREGASLVEITLNDGTSLRVTPDHKMITLGGEVKEAKDLTKGDRLPAFNKRLAKIEEGGKDYVQVHTDIHKSNTKTFEHRLVARFNEPEIWDNLYDEAKASGWIKGGIVVHHKDYDPLNNAPENLEIMTHGDHAILHRSTDNSGEKNPMFGRTQSKETKELIGRKTRERHSDPGYKEWVTQRIREGVTDETRRKISDARHASWLEYYLDQEANTNLDTIWIDDRLYAVKKCKTCGTEMILKWAKRAGVFCSGSCSNADAEVTAAQVVGLREANKKRSADTLARQIEIYLSLQVELGRDPMKKEWEGECRERGVSFRFQPQTKNPNIPKNFADLKDRATLVNHRVVDVCEVEGEHNVYNLTVDDNNTVAIATLVDGKACSGVLTFQCAEIALESHEMCCLVEAYPTKHGSLEEFKKTLKHAYMYAKAVVLMPSPWAETNEVITRNRRIGVSMTGLAEFVETRGWAELRNWMDDGYKYLAVVDEKYSKWLGIRNSIRFTTLKPSGSTGLISGTTPGVHWPTTSGYYLRRIRFHKTDPLLEVLEKAGYHSEPDVMDPSATVVVSFPTEGIKMRSEREVSIWEKAQLAAFTQRYWADNMVSVTVSFKEGEKDQIAPLLRSLAGQLKSISFLPISDEGTTYKQAPYEPLGEKEGLELMSKIKPLDLERLYSVANEAEGEIFCTTDVCELKIGG